MSVPTAIPVAKRREAKGAEAPARRLRDGMNNIRQARPSGCRGGVTGNDGSLAKPDNAARSD